MVRRIVMAAVAVVSVVAGGASPAHAAGCPAGAKDPLARVSLFRDGDCRGTAVSVGAAGSGDRPDFSVFAGLDGKVVDADDSRDSMAVAAATCVRLFDGRGYTGRDSGLLCAPADATGFFPDLGVLKNQVSSMRVCAAAAHAGCDAQPGPSAPAPAPTPAPPPNGAPSTPGARLIAAPRHRTVGFGRASVVSVVLADGQAQPIRGAVLQVLVRPARSGGAWVTAPDVNVDAGGRALIALPPGPSRYVRVEYRAHAGDPQPAAVASTRLDVRAGVALDVRPRHVRGGDAIRISGRLLAAPARRPGKIVTLQAFERGRWRDFLSTRSRGGGRFAARYRFSAGARGTFPIRAVARADGAYPYATGHSRAVRVRVRGI